MTAWSHDEQRPLPSSFVAPAQAGAQCLGVKRRWIPASGEGTLPLPDTSEKLFSNVPRLAVSLEDKPAAPGASPGEFLLTGHCVKLW